MKWNFSRIFVAFALSLLLSFGFFLTLSNPTKVSANYDDTTFASSRINPFEGVIQFSGSQETAFLNIPISNGNLEPVFDNDFSFTVGTDYVQLTANRPNSSTSGAGVFSFISTNKWVPVDWVDFPLFELEANGGYRFSVRVDVSYLDRNLVSQDIVFTYDLYNDTYDFDDLYTYFDAYNNYTLVYDSVPYVFFQYLRINVAYVSYTPTTASTLDFYIYSYEKNMNISQFLGLQNVLSTEYNTVLRSRVNYFDNIVASVNSFFEFQILPNFSLSDLLMVCLAIPLVVWLLKAWLGG